MFQGIFKSAINDANKNYIFGTGSIPVNIKTAQLATFADGTTKQQGYQVSEVSKLISTMLTGWDADGNKPKSMSDNYLELILSCDNGFVVKKRLQFPHIIAWKDDSTQYNIADVYKEFSVDNWLKADDVENPDITLVVEPTDEILTTSTATPPEATTEQSGRFYLYYRNLPVGINRVHIDFHIKTKTEPIDFDLEVLDGLSWNDAQVILASNEQAKINVLLSGVKDVYKFTGAEGNFEDITLYEWSALYQQIINLKPNNKFTHDLYFYIYDESELNTKITELEYDVKENASKVETLSLKIEELRNGELTKNLTNVIENGNFANTSKMVVYYATTSAANNILTCVGNGSNSTPMLVHTTVVSYTPDKKFAFFLRVRVTNDACTKIGVEIAGGTGALTIYAPIKDKWYDVCVHHPAITYTGNAFNVKFYYEDATSANGNAGQIKDAILFEYAEIMEATYPVYKLMNIYKNNIWWSGSKDVIIDNFISENVINHSDNGYLLPCPNAYAATKRPIVTFINVDGWNDDYTKLVAISQKYNVPFVSALFDGSTILPWHCLYLQNELGWEMASHPRNTALADLSTEEEIEQAILETNEYLTLRGLKYHNLVYPYGSHDERVRRIAKKYYRCACTTEVGINTGVVGSFNLKRYPLGYGGSDSTNTLENLKAQVDACVASNGWLIFMLHPHTPEHTTALTETIASLIEYIQSIGVEIMTLNDGYNVHGNAIECGDYTGASTGIAIGFDGNKANI